VRPIRVVLQVEPGILQDSLKELLACENGWQLVAEPRDPVELLLAAEREWAEAVLYSLGEGEQLPGVFTHLLAFHPSLVCVGLCPDGATAWVFRGNETGAPHVYRSVSGLLEWIRSRVYQPERPAGAPAAS
jgi:hypothetical protein